MTTKQIVSIVTTFVFTAIVLVSPITAKAQLSYPNFPSCLNPSGTVKVINDSGSHGVPGDTSNYTGKDIVYTNSDGNYTQCLCTSNGDGIQTNWWKTGSITEEETNTLKADGWLYIPDGSLWGLEKDSYMAKNSKYACTSNTESGGGSSNNSSSNSSSSNGSVQGTSTTRFGQVLGLATTGTLPAVIGYITLGAIALIISRRLTK